MDPEPFPHFEGAETPEEAVDLFIANLMASGEPLTEIGDYHAQFLGEVAVETNPGMANVFNVVSADGRDVMTLFVTQPLGDLDWHVIRRGGWCCPDSGCE